jgi:hypothetical protein
VSDRVYTHLDDAALHRFTRRRLQDRPTDAQAWRANIVELRELAAEIRAREWSGAGVPALDTQTPAQARCRQLSQRQQGAKDPS